MILTISITEVIDGKVVLLCRQVDDVAITLT
jgi:hypothetical protein